MTGVAVDAGTAHSDSDRELIESAALSDADKAALWLLAWLRASRARPEPRSQLGGRDGG